MLRITITYLAFAGIAVGFVACAEHNGSTSTVCQNDEVKRQLFEKYVVPKTTACQRCHGVSQSPLFATTDKDVAYAAAASLLDGKPSRFEVRSGNGHCGSDCNNNAPFVAAMDAYRAELGGVCTNAAAAYPYRSTSVSTSTLRTDGRDTPFTVTFSNATGAMADFVIVVQMRKLLDDPGNCAITRLQYRSPSGNFKVNGAQIWPDGQFDAGLKNYMGVLGKARVTTGTSTADLYLLTQRLACPDEIAVALNVEPVENFPPDGGNNAAAFAYFRDNVYPILTAPTRCISCHQKGHPSLSYTTNDDPPVTLPPGSPSGGGVYGKASSKIYLLDPESSTLVRKPADIPGKPVLPHQGTKTDTNGNPLLSAADIQTFLTWIRMERDAAYPPSP